MAGQTLVPANTAVDNPAPSVTGAIGEIAAGPIIVPPGLIYTVRAYGVEGYDGTGHNVLFLFTGTIYTPAGRIATGLPSASADGTSFEFTGLNFPYGAGTVINWHLINGTATADTIGWYICGDIDEAS